MAEYDRIGTSYVRTRQTDPRIAAQIASALGDACSVVNVGAGTGSYEPPTRTVVAVEPSRVMIAQRPSEVAAVQAIAEQLPFSDRSFDAAMAVLSVHHWQDPRRGLSELCRVARQRIVVLTWDQERMESFWLIRRYFPEFIELDRSRALPLDEIVAILGNAVVRPVPIPWDCRDGFAGAFWRRPEAYLDPTVRSGISPFRLLPEQTLAQGLQCLTEDLRSGAWVEQFGHLLELDELDIGYRLVVCDL